MSSENFNGKLFKNASFNFFSYWHVGVPPVVVGVKGTGSYLAKRESDGIIFLILAKLGSFTMMQLHRDACVYLLN